jgi:hypothetical protein
LSSTYNTQLAALERHLTNLVCKAMECDFEMVGVSVSGQLVRIQGVAPSYAAKARATTAVREAGYSQIENRLRVAPGIAIR